MKWDEWPQEVRDAIEALNDAIASAGPILGPSSPMGREQLSDDDPTEPGPNGDVLLSEWVVVTAWIDPVSGEVWRTKFTSPRLPSHHVEGLLQTFTW